MSPVPICPYPLDKEPRDGRGQGGQLDRDRTLECRLWSRSWEPGVADKEKNPNNLNVNEPMLVKLRSSEERCCIYNYVCKADPLTVRTASDIWLCLSEPAVSHLGPKWPGNPVSCTCCLWGPQSGPESMVSCLGQGERLRLPASTHGVSGLIMGAGVLGWLWGRQSWV